MGSFVVTLVFARQLNDGRRYPAERVVSLPPVALLYCLHLPGSIHVWNEKFYRATCPDAQSTVCILDLGVCCWSNAMG